MNKAETNSRVYEMGVTGGRERGGGGGGGGGGGHLCHQVSSHVAQCVF